MWENDSLAVKAYIKMDTGNHLKNVRSIQLNEQFSWKYSENTSFELHGAYIHSRSIVETSSPWKWQYRLELEANRIFHLYNCIIETRNRLQIERVQKEPKTQYRLRQRTMFIFPLKNAGILKAFSAYNEAFYNVLTGRFNQNRICPCQLTVALSDQTKLDLFFLIRFFLSNDLWQKSAVLGTQLRF